MIRLKSLLFLIFTVIYLTSAQVEEVEEVTEEPSPSIRKIKVDNDRPRAAGVSGWEKTRLLFLEYSFRGESIIYDVLENKINNESTVIEAKYTWETLHHDQGGSILSRLKFVECISGPCNGDYDDVYVHFVQGGNNIVELYMNLKDRPEDYHPKWNFLLGVANIVYTPALSGEGDSQFVDSPYGNCQYTFTRPEDKKFRRVIGGCELDGQYNYSRFDGFQMTKYSQEVFYIQNVKIDADIVIIDAVEELTMRSPLNSKWGFAAESRIHIEMENRTKLYVDRHCDMDTMVADCAVNHFNLTKVGNRKYEGIQIVPPHQNQFGEAVKSYREHLFEMGPSHTCPEHSRLYSALLREGLSATEHDFVEAIRLPDNEPVLETIANVLGSVGTSETLKIAKEILFVESPEMLDPFLFGLANSIRVDEKLHKQLMYWLSEEKAEGHTDTYRKLANTIASVLKRRCEASASSNNACVKANDKVVNKFISILSDTTDDESIEHALLALVNLPYPESYVYARKFICLGRKQGIEEAALQVIQAVPVKFYDSQVIRAAINVFRNTCPKQTSLHEAKLAVDILLESVLDHQNAATLLLRGEDDEWRDEERWNYFYKASEASREQDENKDVLWKQMRAFKVFRPNWNQRALSAKSLAFYAVLGETIGYTSEIETSSLYSGGIFQGSSLKLSISKKKHHYPLFELNLKGENHDSVLRSGEAVSKSESSSPKIDVRMGLFGYQLPRNRLVDGDGDLMAGVWGADGHTIRAFEGNAPLRSYEGSIPLLSGMSLSITSQGSANVKVLGACEISLWNRLSETKIDVNVSTSFDIEANLLANGEPIRSILSKYSTVSSVGSVTEVDFADVPPLACMKTSRQKTPVSFSITTIDHKSGDRKERTIVHKSIPAETYPMANELIEDCNEYHQRDQDLTQPHQEKQEL